MPRRKKPAGLYEIKPRPERGRAGYYEIRDGSVHFSTGCGLDDREGAERELAKYIAAKGIPREKHPAHEVNMGALLAIYHQDVVPSLATAKKAGKRIERLIEWWGDKTLADVNRKSCQAFTASRGPGAARRELQDLQAAINYHHREGLHAETILVTLPPAGEARQRWLTRKEAAHLIRICLHHRETQDGTDTRKKPLKHLARFILFGLYMANRPGDTLAASFYAASGRGFIDLDTGLYIRKPAGKRETKKRQPTVRLPPSILAHCRRWKRANSLHVVEFHREPVRNIKTAWAKLIELAGPEFADVVPYSTRHTAITWMKQRSVPSWEVAGFAGTSEALIDRVYGHHDPNYLKNAVWRK
jgi:hypothetical protein